MEIVKKSANQLVIKDKKLALQIAIDDNRFMDLLLEKESGNVSLSNSGEYEYEGMNIIAMEIPSEKYTGRPNIVVVNLDSNIKILISYLDLDITKQVREYFSSLNVAVFGISTASNVNSALKTFQPEKIVFISKDGKDGETIKSTFSKAENAEGKLKFADSDFESEEDTIQNYYIL